VWALSFLRNARHSSLFDATLKFLTPKILMSCQTHSSHLNLGLPTFLLPSGLVSNTFLIILFSVTRIRCRGHSSLFTFMNLITSGLLHSLYNFHLQGQKCESGVKKGYEYRVRGTLFIFFSPFGLHAKQQYLKWTVSLPYLTAQVLFPYTRDIFLWRRFIRNVIARIYGVTVQVTVICMVTTVRT
jgi:hypothetical protein